MRRYAIFYAPVRGSTLDRFGASWLGWDADAGIEVPRPDIAGLRRDEIVDVTATPRRYGFHGTLKPPMALTPGRSIEELSAAVAAFAAKEAPFVLDGLRLGRLGSFLALVPTGDTAALSGLAARVVEAFDGFRAPATEAEISKRRKAGLSSRQEELLMAWGYPYVMDEFRFHLTLTGAMPDHDLAKLEAALQPCLAPIATAVVSVRELCIFADSGDGTPLCLVRRIPMTG